MQGDYGLKDQELKLLVAAGWVLLPQWEFTLLVKRYRSYKFSMYAYFGMFVSLVVVILFWLPFLEVIQ